MTKLQNEMGTLIFLWDMLGHLTSLTLLLVNLTKRYIMLLYFLKKSTMKNKSIPVVFAFDDAYTLPASIAIKSLIETKKQDTQYEIYCLFSNLSEQNRQVLSKIAPINWIKFDKNFFNDAPATSEYPISVYYRLALHDILTQHDTLIYSDVDVLFQGDLTEAYETDLNDAYRAGIPLEKNEMPTPELLAKQIGNPTDTCYMS
jgi:lipopolysaccharide biosynthesis glycosyltransferase